MKSTKNMKAQRRKLSSFIQKIVFILGAACPIDFGFAKIDRAGRAEYKIVNEPVPVPEPAKIRKRS